MMTWKPGDSYFTYFAVSNPTTGAAVNADALPAASEFRNGAAVVAMGLVVANAGTGIYKISGTIPGGWAAGDHVAIHVSATVGGVVGGGIADQFVLDGYRLADTPPVNVTQVSGDSAAADNLEADYDGTGYAKANSTIGTCTTNTDMRGTDGAYTGTPPTAAAIAAALAGSTINVVSSLAGGKVTITKWARVTIPFTNLGDISDRTELYFSLKTSNSKTEDEALLRVSEGGGLLRLNGSNPGSSSWASMTVVDDVAGDVNVVLEFDATSVLAVADDLKYDVKRITSTGPQVPQTNGEAEVKEFATRAEI